MLYQLEVQLDIFRSLLISHRSLKLLFPIKQNQFYARTEENSMNVTAYFQSC